MEQTSTSLTNLQTRAFALLRKWMKNGSLNETETHELLEIQKEIPTTSVQTKLDSFNSITDAKLDSIKESQDTRFDSVDARFDSVDARFDSVDTRFDSVDARFDSLDARFDSLDAKIDSVKESLDIWFGIILKWLKILTGVGVTVLLTMGIWLIRLMFTIGS